MIFNYSLQVWCLILTKITAFKLRRAQRTLPGENLVSAIISYNIHYCTCYNDVCFILYHIGIKTACLEYAKRLEKLDPALVARIMEKMDSLLQEAESQ